MKRALNQGHEVFSLYKTHLPQHGKPIQVDLTDRNAVSNAVESIGPEVIINTAALTDVDFCETQPELAYRHNSESIRHLADAASSTDAFLLHVSTDYVFNGENGSYAEEDSPSPVNVYGFSKLKGEEALRSSSVEWMIARTSVVYGWGRPQRPNAATFVWNKLSKGEQVRMVKDQYSSPTLNTNLARMLVEIADRRIKGVLHTAGVTVLSRYEFATRLAESSGFDRNLVVAVEAREVEWKAKRPRNSSLNVAAASMLLSQKPLTIDVALSEFLSKTPQPDP